MSDHNFELNDVIIIGAGPAGLNAALILARCQRKTLVFDSGKPRNLKSEAMHGFLSRDGINPLEFLRIAKGDLEKYQVGIIEDEIIKATRLENETFEIEDRSGKKFYCKRLLIATGLIDELPPIPGIEKYYGTSVVHCPYCDGWEMRQKPVAVYSRKNIGTGLALVLKNWTDDIVVLTDGRTASEEEMGLCEMQGIKVITKTIKELAGNHDRLDHIIFSDESKVLVYGLFFSTDKYQKSNIAEQLGCNFTENGVIDTDLNQHTNVPGVFVAGDAAKDIQLVIIAAAEGAKAAIVINKSLQKEERDFKIVMKRH
jgi:thioredoxin reductase